MKWFTGGMAEISREKVRSYHGVRMAMLKAQIQKKKAARQSIANLGSGLLGELARSEDLHERIDDENNLHVRLKLSSLVSGSIEFSTGKEEQVKGRIKLEVYPGQEPLEIARRMLLESASMAEEMGFSGQLDSD